MRKQGRLLGFLIHWDSARGVPSHQIAVAALCAQFDECLNAEENKPERIGLEAHVRAEYVKLGWTGEGEALEWHPEWMEAELSEEAVVQAWLLGRIRMGIRVRTRQKGGEGGEDGDSERFFFVYNPRSSTKLTKLFPLEKTLCLKIALI